MGQSICGNRQKQNSPMHKQGAVMTLTKAEPLLYVLRNYSITKGSVKEQYYFTEVSDGRRDKVKDDSVVAGGDTGG